MKYLPITALALLLAAAVAASAQSMHGTANKGEHGTSASATQCRDAHGQVHMKSPTAGKKGDASTGAHVGSPSGTKSGGAASMTTGTGDSKRLGSAQLAPC